jgi:hypothetical protein
MVTTAMLDQMPEKAWTGFHRIGSTINFLNSAALE